MEIILFNNADNGNNNGTNADERLTIEGFLSYIKGCSFLTLTTEEGIDARNVVFAINDS